MTSTTHTLNRRLADLPGYVEHYIYHIKHAKTIQTQLAYTKDIHLFFEFLAHEGYIEADAPFTQVPLTVIEALTTRDILAFLDYLTAFTRTYRHAQGQMVTQAFQNDHAGKARKLAAIRKWLQYLVRTQQLTHNVAQDIEFDANRHFLIKDALSAAQFNDLMRVATSTDKIGLRQCDADLRLRDRMIIILLGYTGIRVSELVALNREHVRLQDAVIVVFRKGGKAQRIPLSDRLVEAFYAYFQFREALEADPTAKQAVFLTQYGTRMSDQSVRKMLNKYGTAALLPIKLTPHTLRRTFGTQHYNRYQDMDLTAIVLGHASTATTSKHYVRVDETRIKRSLETFEYDADFSQKHPTQKDPSTF